MRRVLFLAGIALVCPIVGLAQSAARPVPKYLSAKPDQAEGGKVLQQFRNVGLQGSYWLEFELRVMPRKGPERLIEGAMFGMQGPDGPLTRLRTIDPANTGGSKTQLYLLHGGSADAAWEWNAGQRGITPRRVEASELLAPMEHTDLTLFDLQMPFLRWTDFVYEGVANVRGRPAHAFLLYPPAPLEPSAAMRAIPAPAAVRVFLDTQFNAMTQAEWLGASGQSLKTVTVLDLKKSGEQWLVKSIDLRNAQTRAKTRFSVKAVALGLDLEPAFFDPRHLAKPDPAVPPAKIERF